MATKFSISKKTKSKSGLKKRKLTPDERMANLDLSLPKSLSEPVSEIESIRFLIYGEQGIGKTSLGARFKKSLTLHFEPGGNFLRTYQRACPEWIYFKSYLEQLKNDSHEYKTLVIDTGALAYSNCLNYICEKHGFEHPGDEGYGKGWNKVSNEFSSQFNYAMSINLGLVVLSHSTKSDITTKSGRTYQKVKPQLTGQAEEYFSGPIDVLGYYHYDGNQRWLQIIGDDFVEAKCRAEENFFTKSGERIHKIPMGNSADEAYENIVKAFNNKQKQSYAPETSLVKKKRD